jgi:hypothetical protein
MLLLSGCARIETVPVTRIDGRPCRTTKVRPDWYSAETWTDCLDANGHAVTVTTNHTDLSEYGSLLGPFLAGVIIGGNVP